jgi:hypothetical protein
MMTYQDAVSHLVRLWDVLPLLVGAPWQELEPPLLDALEQLAAAETNDDRDQYIAQVLRLCLPYEPLRQALEPSIRRDVVRGGLSGLGSWTRTTSEITAAIERSSRPGGDQWLAASLADHPAGAPLRAGRGYDLTIGVTAGGPPAGALAAEPVPPGAGPGPGADSTPLTVEVRGDAGIETVNPVLTLPRHGASPDHARFRVTPRAGTERLTLTAVITQDRMFIQMLSLTVPVCGEDAAAGAALAGASPARAEVPVRGRASGRPLAEAFASDGPDVALWVIGDELSLRGAGPYAMRAMLPYSPEQLAEIAGRPRAALQEIAYGVLDDRAAHQAGVAIPPEIYQTYLAELVRAGALMFRTLFFGPDATQELKDLGTALQGLMSQDEPLWLEVVAKTHVIPWHLIACPDPAGPEAAGLAPILGLRHRVTYLPMRGSTRRPPPARSLRDGDGPLRVVLAVNRDIDEHGGVRRDLVQNQITAWQQRAGEAGGALAVTVPLEPKILNVLVRNMPPAELLYFFCHAHADQDPSRLGRAAASLEFARGYTVSLEELMLYEPIGHEFDAAPLVVLNACTSAVQAPSVYGSFLPYLLARGARGVIGTEADVPPVFAAAWAQEFFSRVLDGVPLADAAFELARDFAQRHRNLLGLVYALHCDGRSLVRPAIPGGPGAPAART